jgi:general stress protein 26
MTDPDTRDFLERAMVARIATVSRTGRPHVNPLYFVVTAGRIHLGTSVPTLAARNVRAASEVQVLFEVERDPDDSRILRMDGTAVVQTDPELLDRYRRRVARKYILTPAGLWNMLVHPRQWIPLRRHTRKGNGCVIDVTPTRLEFIDRPV